MNRLGTAGLGGGDQFIDLQITLGSLAAAQIHTDIGFTAVPRIAVGGAVHGDGGQAQGLGGAHHAAGDFAAVGHQQGGNHRCAHQRDSLVDAACQFGGRFCRKARKPS